MLATGDEEVVASRSAGSLFSRLRGLAWLGQTIASICWISSMLVYGLESTGDWLQLCAASAWLLANVAAFVTSDADRQINRILRSRRTSRSSAR